MKGDISEDPNFPKIQWPAPEMCPKCYSGESDFDENEVADFIMKRNEIKNLVLPDEESLVLDVVDVVEAENIKSDR